MIKLEVEPYCEDCLIFDAEVESPQKMYCGGDLVSKTDTIVHCSHRHTCTNLMRYLKRTLSKGE